MQTLRTFTQRRFFDASSDLKQKLRIYRNFFIFRGDGFKFDSTEPDFLIIVATFYSTTEAFLIIETRLYSTAAIFLIILPMLYSTTLSFLIILPKIDSTSSSSLIIRIIKS